MAGNTRRRAARGTHESRPAAGLVSIRSTLRAEQLEDRLAPAIIQQGIPNWIASGPYPSINAQVANLDENPVTGAVEAISPHPTDPNILFAAGLNGGVWRTTNALAASPTWTPLTDQMPSLSVAAMDINPSNPNQLIVGLGAVSSAFRISGDLVGALYTENALAPVPSFRVIGGNLVGTTFQAAVLRPGYILLAGDTGLYRSTDNGASFVLLGGTGNLPVGGLRDAVADPRNPSRVYVAGNTGVFRTDDINAPTPNWFPITSPLMQLDAATANVKVAVHSTATSNVVWVATANPAPNGTNLVRVVWSVNGGASFSELDEAVTLTGTQFITDATNAIPIAITSNNHGLATGDRVLVEGVQGNLGANGIWTVTSTGQNTFTLDGSAGTGIYVAGSGTFRKIFGVNVGGQADIHFALAADPTDPNLVYLSGDRQELGNSPFENSIGADNFTGNVMRGDRSKPRGFNTVAPSPQWVATTNRQALGGGGPHADSRHLVFDAAGHLLEGDDGGIYRRTIPQTTQGKWLSSNGNLDLGQFYKVMLDTRNNVIFGGTQDTGSVEQLDGFTPGGNTTWDTLAQGDGFWQGVDNTGQQAANRTFRYSMGNTNANFVRREFDAKNNFVRLEPVLMASPANPGKQYDGLDNADKFLFGLNVFTLNAIDGRQMMLGFNKLYEDNDPDAKFGRAGDVIANITPQNFKGTVTSLVYGGKQNGQAVPRISYVSTTAGQLWLRGAAGGFNEIKTVPGTGTINQVIVDPDDWRTSYVLRDNHIYRSTDEGVTWVEITENLAATQLDATGNPTDGLTTLINTIAIWDPQVGTPTGEEIILAGGRGGVYRYVPSLVDPLFATGGWLEYGVQLPNALVFDLQVYNNRLVAGTQGRGVWSIEDLSQTINKKAVVIVQGDATNNTLTMQSDGSNPSFVIVSDGLGNTLRIERTAVQEFQFLGSSGADNVLFLANGFEGGDLNFIRFPVFVDLGGNDGDTLELRNLGKTAATKVTITASVIGGEPTDNFFSSVPGTRVTYTGLQKGNLIVDLGADAPSGNEVYIKSTSAATTRVFGSNARDAVFVNSNAGADTLGTLTGIVGNVAFDGRGGFGQDTLTVSDFGAASGNANVVVGTNAITGLAGLTDAATVFFNNSAFVVIQGSDDQVLGENYTVINPATTLTIQANGGPDKVNVRATQRTAFIDGGVGDDVIRVGSLAGIIDDGDLSQINGNIVVEAGLGDNRLIVSDFGRSAGSTVGISSNLISGASKGSVQYAATGGRFFSTGGDGLQYRGSTFGTDTFVVQSTLDGSQTAIDGNGGNDAYNVDAESLLGDVWLRGGDGDDGYNLGVTLFGVTSNALRLSGGAGRDTALMEGFETDDNTTMTLTDAVTGRLTGVNRPVDFDTVEGFTFDGQTGRNNFTYVDATNQKYGSLADPAAGIVFKPFSETSAEIAVARGTVGPVVTLFNMNGNDVTGIVINGDPTGTGNFEDTLTYLGLSEPTVISGFGESAATFGSDEIFVGDTGVTLRNATLGFMRSVSISRSKDGNPSISTLVVKGGNEVTLGDRFSVLPSSTVNIFVDGGAPTKLTIGDKLEVATTATSKITQVVDPIFGPISRLVTDAGAGFGFTGFENTSEVQAIFAVGADTGGGPRVRVFDPRTNNTLLDGFVYDPSFTGGVRVATGDVTGDGVADLVTAAGPGGGPHVQVFDGTTFELIAGFFAYEPTFGGGVFVAIGDIDGDGIGEIITGSGNGGGPLVRIFSQFGVERNAFFAYADDFRGGVRIAVGDLDGDGIAEVVTGAGNGGGPHVRVFNALTAEVTQEFLALDENFRNGIFVAVGDMDGDGQADIVIGPGGDNVPEIRVRRTSTGEFINIAVFDIGEIAGVEPLPAVAPNVLTATGSPPTFEQGIRVAVTDGDVAGRKIVVAARGPGYASRVHTYGIDPSRELSNFLAFEGFEGGVWVG